MPERDTTDFVTAFAIGAVLGVGAALLLRPEQPTGAKRIMKELEPYRKKMAKSSRRMKKGLAEGTDAAADLGKDLAAAGRDLVGEFRGEIADILADARRDFTRTLRSQVKGARKAMRSTARRMR